MAMTSCSALVAATLTGLAALAAPPALAAGQPVTIEVGLVAGDAAVTCDGPAVMIGAPPVAVTLRDARFYLHDIALVTDDGRSLPLHIDETVSQHAGVVLIDAETATAGCRDGTPDTSLHITGQIDAPAGDAAWPGPGTWRLAFTLGVPERLNHTATDLSPPPLDLAALGWGWQAGRKYLKLEVLPEGGVARPDGGRAGTWFLHLGATGCTGNPVTGEIVTCTRANRARIVTGPFDPAHQRLVLDLDRLFAAINPALDQGGAVGCMSAPDDADCPAAFAALGLDGGPGGAFRVAEK